MDNKNNDRLIQQCTCPICKATVLLEYEKRVSRNMVSYNIKILKGCKHFIEGETISEQYVRLLNSLIKDIQIDYNRLVESRTKRKLEELGINKNDIRSLF